MQLLKLSLLSAASLFTSVSIFAQSGEDRVNHFSLGVSAGLLQDQWDLNSMESPGEGITPSSKGLIGYSGSISGAYDFSKHWKLKIAPGIQSRKFDYRLDGLHFDVDFNGTGFNDSHAIYHVKATVFTVPLIVEYVFGTKKILPFVSLGLAGEWVLKQTADGTIYYSDGTTDPTKADDLFRKSNIAALAGAGIYYRAGNKISVSISPWFSYSLLNDALNCYQYSFGVAAGVFYNLNK